MMGVVAANALVTRFYARSIFHRQIQRWGIDLNRPPEQRLMHCRQVDEIMSAAFLSVPPDRSAADLSRLVSRGQAGDVFVVEPQRRRLLGKLPLAVLLGAGPEQTAEELCEPAEFWFQASDNLWDAFLRMETFVGYAAPVVADRASMSLLGVVTEGGFIAAYRQTVDAVREEQRQ